MLREMAEKPPPIHVFEQVALIAAGGVSFSCNREQRFDAHRGEISGDHKKEFLNT